MGKGTKRPVCPHCGANTEPTNAHIYRCQNYAKCGRYCQ